MKLAICAFIGFSCIAASAQIGGNPLTGGSGGGVTTFNARTGDVLPATNDYSFAQISGQISPSQQPATTMQAVGTRTANNMLKWVTSNTAADSSLSDNGTTITTTEPITAPTFTGALAGNATTATTATNLACGTLLGDIPYFSAASTIACLPGSITSTLKILTQTGNGTISAAPAWSAVTGTGTPVMSASPTVTGTWNMGAISMTGTVTSPRWNPSGTAPTIAAGTGAGTSAAVSVTAGSTNTVGQITIVTGTTPAAAATIATITFNGTVSPAPRAVILFPANATAALDTLQVFTNVPSTTTWTMTSGATGVTGSLTHIYFYLVL